MEEKGGGMGEREREGGRERGGERWERREGGGGDKRRVKKRKG